MKRSILAVLALVLAIGLLPQTAHAQDNNFWSWLFGRQDPRLTAVGIGLGIGADVASFELTRKHGYPGVRSLTPLGAYGATSAACVVAYPFVATIVLNRPLTPREAYVGMANCIVPFLGGWFVDASLPHTAWYDGTPEKPVHKHHK
jgi:hypothetical protein